MSNDNPTAQDYEFAILRTNRMAHLVFGNVYAFGTPDLTLATGASTTFSMMVPATSLFATVRVQTTSENLSFRFYSGGTVTGGTPVPLLNLNQSSTHVFPTTVYQNPTISVAGTLIMDSRILGTEGQGNSEVVTGWDTDAPFMLAPDTQYYMTVINNGAATHPVVIGVEMIVEQIPT